MYIETSYNRFGDRARLGSPILKGSCTLRMFYHMYGQHVNALVVYMRTTTNGPLQRKVNMSGNIGDNWIRAEVPVTNGNQPFQVVIEGKLNYISEFAATGTTKCVLAVSPLQQFQIFFKKKKKHFILYVVVKTVIDVSFQKARSALPWVPEVFSRVRRGALSATGRRHERRSREKKIAKEPISKTSRFWMFWCT